MKTINVYSCFISVCGQYSFSLDAFKHTSYRTDSRYHNVFFTVVSYKNYSWCHPVRITLPTLADRNLVFVFFVSNV